VPDGVRLLAVSDLHVNSGTNRAFVADIAPSPNDWLVLAGDMCESNEDLRWVFATLKDRFAQLIWVPGNHELWSLSEGARKGELRYRELCAIASEYGVLTPEDPYPTLPGTDLVIAPMFLLYDYTFAPDEIDTPEKAIAWAQEDGIKCADEIFLQPDPYPTREAWCAARCEATARRLDALGDKPTILINHFPLRQAHARLPLVPRFSIWCGTRRTEDWHLRYRAKAVVFGHLHIRQERIVDGVRFHEVSLGHKRQWNPDYAARYIRQVWPIID